MNICPFLSAYCFIGCSLVPGRPALQCCHSLLTCHLPSHLFSVGFKLENGERRWYKWVYHQRGMGTNRYSNDRQNCHLTYGVLTVNSSGCPLNYCIKQTLMLFYVSSLYPLWTTRVVRSLTSRLTWSHWLQWLCKSVFVSVQCCTVLSYLLLLLHGE